MPYIPLCDFKTLVEAFNLRIGLLEAQEYKNPSFLREKPTVGEVLFGKGKDIDVTLPIYDENSDVFAKTVLEDSFKSATINSSVRIGTIIKYDTDKIYPKYGLVITPPSFSKKQGVYVKNITASEASDLKERNHAQKEVEVGEESLRNVSSLERSVKRQQVSENVYNFIFGDGTINFLDGLSAMEFMMIFLILTVFFVSFGVLISIFF